ncbi:MAG: DNA primase [Bacteroidota bacterium]
MITKPTIDKIFDAARIDEVVGDYVTLKKRGVNMIALCPFHNEKTPSFTVSPAKGIYKCFGCGAGGNAINFVMKHEKYTYPEALRFLAKKYNIEIEEEERTEEEVQREEESESLYVVQSFAQQYFTRNLHETGEGKAIGLSYFKERGFREETIKRFQLGYSQEEWDGFTKTALKSGYKLEFLVKTGLTISSPGSGDATTSGDKKHYDRFRGRVIFPIHNLSGRVPGFGGRILKSDAKAAKYINSPESEIYEKRKSLYGLFFAKKSIIAENNCYLVEGYTDVISLHQAGIGNVVASSGTSLTEEQIRLIKRYTRSITFLYDGDPAGIKASLRGTDLVLEQGMNVKVVLFPDGEDPDSFAKKINDAGLKQFIIDNAKDFIVFKTRLLLEESKNDPIKKTALIRDIVESIAVIPDAIARSVYVQECSKTLNISEQALLNELNKIRRKKLEIRMRDELAKQNLQDIPIPAGTPTQPFEDVELHKLQDIKSAEYQERDIIRFLLNYGSHRLVFPRPGIEEPGRGSAPPDEDGQSNVEISVAEFIINEIVDDQIEIESPIYRKIFDEFLDSIEKQIIPDQQHFLNHLDIKISELAVNLVFSPYSLSDNWKKHKIYVRTEDMLLKQAVERSVYSLKISKLKIMISEMQNNIKDATAAEDRTDLMQQYHRLLEIKKIISKQLGRVIS